MSFQDFHEDGLDCLKVKRGEPTDYYYVLRISSRGSSHLTFGQLLRIGTQLFCMYTPEMEKGSFLRMRQDTKDNNTLDLEIVFRDSKPIKPPEIHHLPCNNDNIYWMVVPYKKWRIEIFIMKDVGYDNLIGEFRNHTDSLNIVRQNQLWL